MPLPIKSVLLFLAIAPFSLLAPAHSQTSPPIPHDFEVASIHRVEGGHTLEDLQRGIGLTSVGPYGTNKFTARNITLDFLIQIAFAKDGNRITGKPDWLDTEQYDVIAEADTALTREQMQPLLQHLLESRFHLKTHTETIEVPGYALVPGKTTSKLKPSTAPTPHGQILPNGLQGFGYSLDTLAAMIERPAGRPVINRTAIPGIFDFTLSYAPENSPDSNLPSIFTAIQDQLGLKLQPQKISIERLVIDHVDKIPTDN